MLSAEWKQSLLWAEWKWILIAGRVKISYCGPSENESKLCEACRCAIKPWDCIQLILPITNRLNEVNDPELTLIAMFICEISIEKTLICLHYGTVFQTALLWAFSSKYWTSEKICRRSFLTLECIWLVVTDIEIPHTTFQLLAFYWLTIYNTL